MKLFSIILVFVASSAFAEIYTWSDARGARHYTNREDEIPVRYRARARSLNYGAEPQAQGGTTSPQRSEQVQSAPPAEQPAARITAGNSVPNIIRSHAPDSGKKALRQQKDERMQEKIKARAAGRASKNKD
jgi:hypothetical protein